MRGEIIKTIEEAKIISIVRGVKPEILPDVAEALYEGGIRLMEITFDLSDPGSFAATASSIEKLKTAFDGKMAIGAGTVVSAELVKYAYSAGAEYVISPDANEEVIRLTRELGMVSIPGCMTPSEITAASRYGADFIKLFPAGSLGPGYLKAIKAPLSNLKILAVGGIDESNVGAFLKAGASGFGIGGNLVNRKIAEEKRFSEIVSSARTYVNAVSARS